MTEKPDTRVSMTKPGASAAKPSSTPSSKSTPPRQVKLAVGAMLLAGVAAVVAGIDLFGLKGWLLSSAETSNKKSSSPVSQADLVSQVNKTPMSQLVVCIVLLVALVLVAGAAYRGRYFARWMVLGVWILGSLTPTPIGFSSVIGVGASVPMGYKAPTFVAGIAMIAAVVLVNLRPSVEYFNANRPARPDGAPQRRGLFAPRPPLGAERAAASTTRPATTRPAAGSSAGAPAAGSSSDRSRSKQRASADAVAKGAELARTRAKAASKSRRTGS